MIEGEGKPPGAGGRVTLFIFFRCSTEESCRLLSSSSNGRNSQEHSSSLPFSGDLSLNKIG